MVYRCTFHGFCCPTYRRKGNTADADTRPKEIIRQACEKRSARITKLETMPDHVHLLADRDLQHGIHG